MFKRRDWVYTHNPDTGDVTSDSDSEGGTSEGEIAEGQSDADSQGESEDGPHSSRSGSDAKDEDVDVQPMRMEDLQEMIDSEDSDEDNSKGQQQVEAAADVTSKQPRSRSVDPVAVEDQKAEWLQAPEGTAAKGVPLRCMLCKNKLLVNSIGFQLHMRSKAHLTAAKRQGLLDDPLKQLDSVIAAASVRPHLEETETHRERIDRFRQIAESLKQQQQQRPRSSEENSSLERKKKITRKFPTEASKADGGLVQKNVEKAGATKSKRKRTDRSSGEKPKRKKPGKRQRMAAKASAAAQ